MTKIACQEPIRNHGWGLVITSGTLCVVATVFIVARAIARSPRRCELFGWDDILILIAYVRFTDWKSKGKLVG